MEFTAEIKKATDPIYQKISKVLPEIEWPIHAPYIHKIKKLKKEKNAIVLAHNYQTPEIYHGVADLAADSLALAVEASKTSAAIIVMAGVHFMAETAKIINPSKKVLLPDLKAGCSLAESCPADEFAKYKADRPDHIVISYVNCSAEVKALTDIVCTSTNAVQIIESLPEDQKIIFGPDRNLGAYLEKKTGREMAIWDGSCMVHEIFSLEKIITLKAQNPGSEIIAHPECEAELLDHSTFIGSTAALLKYSKSSNCNIFIVATESGILHQMAKESPEKTFIPAPPTNTCACNDCPHMRLNTLEKLYNCLKFEYPELTLDESLVKEAKKPIIKMLEISERLGL